MPTIRQPVRSYHDIIVESEGQLYEALTPLEYEETLIRQEVFTHRAQEQENMLSRIEEQSVLSPSHRANNYRHGAERNATYVFRQRSMKLNLTLGWELEANHVPSTSIPNGIERISDGSVDGDGAEFIVMPAVTKSPRYVLGLLKDLVHMPKLNTNKSCGFHIHVSASNLASSARMKQWAIATEHLGTLIEDLAFKSTPDSRKDNQYCRRIVPLSSGTSFSSNKYSNDRRYHWLNTVEMFRPGGIRTIEIRLLGHTHRWKYLLAWSLFCMELARRGWEISNNPFEVSSHVDALSRLLINIEKDVKPLSKKLEPIPQWVYNGLKTFDIEPSSWERPLARLSESETDLRGLIHQPYSDDQPEEDTPHNDDECSCGCGNEGRCNSQYHSDGDCNSHSCEYCHDDGHCDGSPQCARCRNNRHEDGEDCERRTCALCHPLHLPGPVAPSVDSELAHAQPIDGLALELQARDIMTNDEWTMTRDRYAFYPSINHRGGR